MLKRFMKDVPKHIAFTTDDLKRWSRINSKEMKETLEGSNKNVINVIDLCVRNNIPVFTFNLFSPHNVDDYSAYMDSMIELLENLSKNPLIHENKVRVSIIGKWYDLPGKVVDSAKEVMSETSEYDQYFLNLCINYDGKEEILDALRVILRKVNYQKISPMNITKDLVKENLYTSYFIPPDIIVFNGYNKTNSFLLWDCSESVMYFSGKDWCDFTKKDFKSVLDFYRDQRKY